MKQVVILGGGFAGMSAARRLERNRDVAVTLVNRKNYMLFTPMLPEVSSGAIEPRHIAQPLRVALRRARFELADVTGVDFANQSVELADPLPGHSTTIHFDALVIAVGATSSTHGIPGAQEHSFPLKGISDAIALRDQTIRMLETAAPGGDPTERRRCLTFIVVGGGFTGVEATIMALAARTADYLVTHGNDIFSSDVRNMETSPIRRRLSPPDTWGHGMPHI